MTVQTGVICAIALGKQIRGSSAPSRHLALSHATLLRAQGGKDQRRASQDGSWAGCLSAEPLADPWPWGPMSPKEEPTCLAGKQCRSPADLAHGQDPAQRLVGMRRKPERPVPFHLELAPCRWTAAADESEPLGLGSNDKRVQLGNVEACRLHQSIRSRIKNPHWKESQNFFERRTLMHHQDGSVSFTKS